MTTEESVLQFHQALLAAKTVAEQKQVLAQAIKPLGYNRFLFGIVLGLELDKPRELLIIDHSEGTWRADYVARRLYRSDPTVRHCMNYDVPLRWDHIFDGIAGLELTTQEQEFVAMARSAGYRWGITVPVSMAWSPLRFGMSYALDTTKPPQVTSTSLRSPPRGSGPGVCQHDLTLNNV